MREWGSQSLCTCSSAAAHQLQGIPVAFCSLGVACGQQVPAWSFCRNVIHVKITDGIWLNHNMERFWCGKMHPATCSIQRFFFVSPKHGALKIELKILKPYATGSRHPKWSCFFGFFTAINSWELPQIHGVQYHGHSCSIQKTHSPFDTHIGRWTCHR